LSAHADAGRVEDFVRLVDNSLGAHLRTPAAFDPRAEAPPPPPLRLAAARRQLESLAVHVDDRCPPRAKILTAQDAFLAAATAEQVDPLLRAASLSDNPHEQSIWHAAANNARLRFALEADGLVEVAFRGRRFAGNHVGRLDKLLKLDDQMLKIMKQLEPPARTRRRRAGRHAAR
jgi:hypothetical protein